MSLASPNLPGYRPGSWLKIATQIAVSGTLFGLVLGSVLILRNIHGKVEQTISRNLGRSVQLGGLRGISPRGVWLGNTFVSVGAPYGLTGQMEAVIVNLDWGALLRQQDLRATITLVRPDFFMALPGLESDLGAMTGELKAEATSGPIAALETLHIEGGTLTLRGSPANQFTAPPSLTFEALQATVRWPLAAPTTFAVVGHLGQGSVQARGTVESGLRSLWMTAATENFPLDSLNLVLPPSAAIRSGTLNSYLSLNGLDTDALQLSGTATVQAGHIQLGQSSAPIDGLQSTLTVENQRLTLTDTQLQLGPMTLTVAGKLDRQTGYDLRAETSTVTATDLRTIVGDRLPLDDAPWQGLVQITGSVQEPIVGFLPNSTLALPGRFTLDLGVLGLAQGLQTLGLPARDWIGPIEGATYQFGRDGAWFTLSDGTVVPPLSEAAYQRASRSLGSSLSPALDRKFFWLLQTNPYITAIAADLAKGKLGAYRQGNRFDTDRFFLDYFLPVYIESSRAAGLDPGEALWMLDHSLRTLHDPLLRQPNAQPITSGSGQVGSFWADEQLLSMQQILARPLLAKPGKTGHLARLAVLKQLDASTTLGSRQLSSTPEVMAKIPNVTVGAEEGAIALALGMMRIHGEGIYPEQLRSLAASIEQNELDKHALRSTITAQMKALATDQTAALGFALQQFTDRDWAAVGMGKRLFPGGAAHLNGSNTLSVMVSRQEKAGYSLEQAYENSRLLLLAMMSGAAQQTEGDDILYAIVKDHAFSPQFWQILSQKEPILSTQLGAFGSDIRAYRQLAQQGADLHAAFYTTLVTTNQDIGVSAALKQAVGFQAHLGRLLDQAFTPADPSDQRYRTFRRSLAIYLREAPDISVYGGTEASLRLYGQETLNVQELVAVDVADAPRIRAMARLYHEALAHGLITEWDVAGFQRILITGALLAAGVERSALPVALQGVGFPSPEFRRDLLFVVGSEGIQIEATRLGAQAHDHRVSFQPIARPQYRSPPLNGADAASCPSEPYIAAIALGAATTFIWDAEAQRVMLRRGTTHCPLPESWTTLFFPALLESSPVEHSPAGRDRLQDQLQTARRLEAGIF